MKQIGLLIAAFVAMRSFFVFGVNAKIVNAADEEAYEKTSLTLEDINELANESSSNVSKAAKNSDVYNYISADTSIDGTIYSSGKDAKIVAANNGSSLKYGNYVFNYGIQLGTFKQDKNKKGNTNYIEFTLSKAMNLTFFMSVSNTNNSGFVVNNVEYGNDDTFTVLNSMSSSSLSLAKTLYRYVYALAAGTYQIGVDGATSYLYGIYSDNAENTGDLTASNVANIDVKETVSSNSMDVVVDDSNYKLVYFIYTLTNVTDKSLVTATCTRTVKYSDGRVVTANLSRKLVSTITYEKTVLEGYEAKENTYYVAYSAKIDNLPSNDGLVISVDFDATIDGVTTNLAQSSTYTFNYEA